MDHELEALATEALVNAFYVDFSALVNKYLEMGAGLDRDHLENRLHSAANVWSRDSAATTDDVFINLYARMQNECRVDFDTMVEALEEPKAIRVWLQGEIVFERKDGEWWSTQ